MCPVMTCSPDTPLDRARALVGTPFRLHGRDPDHGLDCVGLVGVAFRRSDGVPIGYALRGNDQARWIAQIDALAMRRSDDPQPGDILLMRAGVVQLHLGMWSGHSLIHADATLGRVVETPGKPPWPIIGAWFVSEG
jgi:murein DD-endopeptidase / murein LD-carboxypeptidase